MRFVLENVITGTLIYQKQSVNTGIFVVYKQCLFLQLTACIKQSGYHQAKFVKFKFFAEDVVAQLAEALHYKPEACRIDS